MRSLLFVFLFLFFVQFGITQNSKNETNPYLPKPKGQAWLDLMTGKIFLASDVMKPSGPIVWGMSEKGQFEPSRIVDFAQTAEEPDPKYVPAWIDMSTGRIHQDMETLAPQNPYLRGRIDTKGFFHVYPNDLKKWVNQSAKEQPPAPIPVPRTDERDVQEAFEGAYDSDDLPREFTIYCRGGGDMVVGVSPGRNERETTLTVRFRHAGYPALREPMEAGECSQFNRSFYLRHPTTFSVVYSRISVGVTLHMDGRYEHLSFAPLDRGDRVGIDHSRGAAQLMIEISTGKLFSFVIQVVGLDFRAVRRGDETSLRLVEAVAPIGRD